MHEPGKILKVQRRFAQLLKLVQQNGKNNTFDILRGIIIKKNDSAWRGF